MYVFVCVWAWKSLQVLVYVQAYKCAPVVICVCARAYKCVHEKMCPCGYLCVHEHTHVYTWVLDITHPCFSVLGSPFVLL